jgi:dCMP deaminase
MDWDEYFLNISKVVSCKSKDPNCKVGAVITSADNLIISTGFNGLARGIHDDSRVLENTYEKLSQICHAEFNAIVNASRVGIALKGASIYVTKFPCLGCCNAIIQAGIERIYTHDDKFWDDDRSDPDHSRKKVFIEQTGIEIHAPFHPYFKPIAAIK